MNRFLFVSVLLTFLTVSYSAALTKTNNRLISYDVCYHQNNQERVVSSFIDMALFTFNCASPDNDFSGEGTYDITAQDFDNAGAYSDAYVEVTLAAGESATMTVTGTDVEMQNIGTNCAAAVLPGVTTLDICGPTNFKLRIRQTASLAAETFDFTLTITNIEITDIDITENSGSSPDDGFLCVGDDLTLEALFNTTPTGGTYEWTGPGGFTASGNPIDILAVQTTNTGTYTVIYEDDNGCTSTEFVLITVDPLPEFTIEVSENSGVAVDDGILCVGDDMTLTVNFTVSSGSSYEWDFPGGGTSTVYPLDITGVTIADHSGTFTVTVTDNNGCSNTAEIMITVEELPQVFTTTLRACETIKNGGTADFTLEDAEEVAGWPTGNQNTGDQVDGGAGFDVTYHGSQSDAMNGVSTLSSPYPSGTTTIWARVEDPSTGCFDVIEVELEVDDKPDTEDTELRACAIIGNPTQAEFELEDAELSPDYPNNQNFGPNDVQAGNGGVTVTYHPSLGDAEMNTGELASPYVSGNTTIFARIEDDVTGCFHTAEITLTVVDLPDFDIEPSETSALVDDDGILCEDDELTLTVVFNSGSGDTYEWDYPGGTSSDHPLVISNVTIAEHNGTFTVTVTDANGCSNTAEIDITIEPLPDVFTTTLRECETTKGSGDAEFNLPDAEEPAGWPGTNQNTGTEVDGGAGLDVSYHANETDARDDAGALSSPYVSGTATIWARVEDPSTGCFDVIEVELEVDDKPDTEDTELSACALLSDPSMAEFELEDAELAPDYPNNQNSGSGQVNAGAGGVTVTYHPSLGDAEMNTGELASPYMSGSTTIYARVEDDNTGCFHTAQIELVVVALPSVSDTELKACEDPAGSMEAEFTLTDAELAPDFPNGNSNDGSDITNGDGTLIVTYHDSQQDAEDNAGDIGTVVFRADGTTVYARLEDPATGCFNVAEILLTALESPDPEIQFMGDPADFETCEDEEIDLDVVVMTGTGPYEYEWTLPDNSTATGNPYNFTADPDVHDGTWTVTVTDANGCTGTDEINITVDPAPENNDCGSAEDVGTGYDPISFSGNNICASSGGPCPGADSESAVYFVYTVPDDGLTRLVVDVPGFQVSIGTGCGSGNCEPSRAILECPDPGAEIFITVSSSEANEGSFSGSVIPVVEIPDITGRVFVDLDANGTFSGNDIPLGGVEIELYPDCDRGATPLTFTTGDDGVYTFTDLPFPPRQWFVTVSENSDVQCDGAMGECIILDLCAGEDEVFDFPCSPPDCTSNPFSIDNICQTAFDNPLCDLRVIEQWPCGQNPPEMGPWLGASHCQGIFHNTSFYGFVAGSGDYEINFTIFNCAGTGVQYGVYDECDPNAGPICNGNSNTGTVTIPSDQLTPCRTYVFWIDGWAGSVCSYYAFVTGDWNNCSVPPVADIEFDPGCFGAVEPYCPSFIPRTLTLIPDDSQIVIPLEDINDARYIWSITSPSGNLITLDEVVGPEGITQDWIFAEPGIYTVCVVIGHPCDGYRDPFCVEIEFAPIIDVDTTFVVCTGDFPWSGAYDEDGNEILDEYGNPWFWIGGNVTLGMVRQRPPIRFGTTQADQCGCPYTQNFTFLEATTSTGTDSIALCPSEIPFAYNGIDVEQNMTDSLIRLAGIKSVNGCDSLVSLTARILTMGGRITDDCVDNNNSVPPTFRLTFAMGAQFINVDRDSVRYVWKDDMGNVLSGTDSTMTAIVVNNIGTYTLEIFSYKFGKQCLFTLDHTFNVTNRLPAAVQADNWPQRICDTDNVATYSVVAADPTLTYIWTVPSTATKIQDDSTGTITVRWDGPTGGDVCVFARNNCGDGPPTCLPVDYVAPTTPDFSMAVEVCKDGRTPITATSTHLNPPVLYFWDFDGGSPENPAGNNPGPHNVSWNDSGDKLVSLYVTENGCPSDTVTRTISVIDPTPPPVLSCFESTVDGVVFEWTEIPGATGYNVQVITAGVTGVQEGANRFRVSGLNVGQCVEIQVEAIIPNACGNVTSAILECCASNCVLPTITITPFAEICLTSTSPVLPLTASIVTINPDTPGTGTFSVRGEGTTDFVDVTEFDPNVWGIGTHTVRYTLVWDGGVCRQTGQTTLRVKETPSSAFAVGTPGCVLNPVTVEYTGGGSTGTFTWNFGPNVIGNYAGPGPHNVRWSTVGPHTITLQVSRDGCVSTVTTQSVTLNPTLASPMVTCIDQRRDGVTFGWDAVNNASGYNVTVTNVTTGAVIFTGFVTDLTQDVPGLNQGDNVQITVEAVANNGCPNTQDTENCIASACPQARITFPVNPIVVCNSDEILPLTFTITNNLPGIVPVVTWTSTSAGVNSDNGTFNVRAAGPGTHIITLTYTQQDCEWSEELVITVRPVPVASFDGPAVICIDDAWFVNYTGTMSGGRVLTWDNGGGNRTELGPNDFSFRFTSAGTYTIGLRVTLNGCESDLFTRQVEVEAVPNSPVVRCESTDFDRVTFAWDPIPCATEYDIRINGAPRPRQTTTTFTATGLMEDEMVEIEVIALSTCACEIPPVTHSCIAKACPTRTVDLPQDRLTFCIQDTVIQLVSSITPAPSNPEAVVTWTTTANGLNTTNNTFDIQAAGVGTHTLTVTYRHDGCQWSRNLTVVVNPVPVAEFTGPAVICVEDSWDVVYTGSMQAGRTYIWNEDGAVRNSTSLINHSFQWTQAGNYNVSLQVNLNGCLSNVYSQSVEVEAVPDPVVIRCADTSFDRVSFEWDPVPCATEYDIKINGGNRPRQTATTFTLTNLNEGDVITIEVTPVSTCACPIAASSRTCIARACPNVVINLVPAQSAICLTNDAGNVRIAANITGNTPAGRGTWTGPGMDQNGNFSPRAAGLGTHVIVYNYEDSDCSYQATTQIEVNDVPRIVWEVANPLCFDDLTGAFLYTIEGGTPPYTTTVDGRNVSGNQAAGLSIGAHSFVVTDAKGCSATQAFNIVAALQPSFTIRGPVILDVAEDGTHNLNLTGMTGVNIDSIVWLLNDVRICGGIPPACTSITSRYPKGPQRFNVTIYYNNGCEVTATSSFIVTQTFVTTFPSIIYPSSNSGNREFRIFTGDPTLFVKKMRIYDRWGNLVFIAENFSAQDPAVWNGRFNGQDVAQGVYVFIFEMENENEDSIIESGDVTVIW